MKIKAELQQGDCLEIMATIPDNSVDLVLVDPPYGVALKPQRKTSKFKGVEIIGDDNLAWLPAWCVQLHRVAKNAAFIFCDYKHLRDFQTELERVGFEIKNVLIWNKDWFGMGNNFRPMYEMIILAVKGKYKTKSNNLSNILTFRRMAPSKMVHVAEKPIKLLELLINESSEPGDIVLDTFMGSGSTGVACMNTGRHFTGIELDPAYFAAAASRIESARLAAQGIHLLADMPALEKTRMTKS
jgi:site-specific DNA-methyltransferase (adenine-specific)